MIHNNTAYQNGCRCDACRLAHKIYANRYRAARERRGGKVTERGIIGGHLFLPVEPTAALLSDLRAVLTLRRTGTECGISTRTVQDLMGGQRKRVHPRVAGRIEAAWQDFCAPLEADTQRWPSLPVRDAVVAVYGSVKASPWSRDVRRIVRAGSVSTDTAENWAERLGRLPYELWPDWCAYGLEETG